MPDIELKEITIISKTKRLILDTISCRFQSDEFTIITGQSASGKTSLMSVIGAQLQPQSGKIRNNGIVIGLIQEAPGIFLTLRIGTELNAAVSQVPKTNRQQIYSEALEWSGLQGRESEMIHELSHSEMKFLAISCALARKPDFLLIDEPFTNLDKTLVCKLIKRLLRAKAENIGIIISCQDLDRVLAHADRLILLKQGRIIADALPERVLPFLEAHGVRKPPLKLTEMTWIVD